MKIKQKKIIIAFIVALVLVVIDQIIKCNIPKEESIVIIENFLDFTYVQNTGAAFGIGANNMASFIVVNLIILGLVIRFLVTQIERMNIWTEIPIILILAGGSGNLIDRIFKGFVVDFIDINNWIVLPVFNLGDIYITLGWLLFLAITIINYIRSQKEGKK